MLLALFLDLRGYRLFVHISGILCLKCEQSALILAKCVSPLFLDSRQ